MYLQMGIYVSRLQRSTMNGVYYLGLRPRLVCVGPLALEQWNEMMTHHTRASFLRLDNLLSFTQDDTFVV